jgi:hypothetical protein
MYQLLCHFTNSISKYHQCIVSLSMYQLLRHFSNSISKYHQCIVSLSMYYSEDLLLDCLSQSNCSFHFCFPFYTHLVGALCRRLLLLGSIFSSKFVYFCLFGLCPGLLSSKFVYWTLIWALCRRLLLFGSIFSSRFVYFCLFWTLSWAL